MDRRLFYSAPSLDIAQECQALARELHLAEDNFSVISLNSKALQDRQLRGADYLKSLDLPRRSVQGLGLGFAGGAILLALLELIQPYGLNIPASYYWAPIMFTACFGLWLGIMVGLGETNHHIRLKTNLQKEALLSLLTW